MSVNSGPQLLPSGGGGRTECKSLSGSIAGRSRSVVSARPVSPGAFSIYGVCKRGVDVLVSAIVLGLSLPLSLLVAIAIRLDSRGPVLFSQERAGRDGNPFRMLKFRSMFADAERRRPHTANDCCESNIVFKARKDPRITRVGRFLRRSSLDELPQFLNVLMGHMSLVGPRPLPVSDIGHHGPLPPDVSPHMVDDWVEARQQVRPGITGLWQINGRSLLPLQGWIRYDMEYVRRRGLLLDASILLLTPLVVLTGRGAV